MQPTKTDLQLTARVLDYLSDHIVVSKEANDIAQIVNSMLHSTCKHAQRIVELFIPYAQDDIVN